jgi:4'-phosphopantetheinyl transferase
MDNRKASRDAILKDNSIFITFAMNDRPIENLEWILNIIELPEKEKNRCNRFIRWQDRQACIIGKMLLGECLEKNGFSKSALIDLQTDKNGKPFITSDFCFSISHCDGCVVCAFTSGSQKIGIDIEKINDINPKEFQSALGTRITEKICTSKDPINQFYRHWTVLESALKADGRGFLAKPATFQIDWNKRLVVIDVDIWHLTQIMIAPGYICHLSSSTYVDQINIYQSEIITSHQKEFYAHTS